MPARQSRRLHATWMRHEPAFLAWSNRLLLEIVGAVNGLAALARLVVDLLRRISVLRKMRPEIENFGDKISGLRYLKLATRSISRRGRGDMLARGVCAVAAVTLALCGT